MSDEWVYTEERIVDPHALCCTACRNKAGITWREHPEDPGIWLLDLHRDGWDIEVQVGRHEHSFYAARREARDAQ